MDTLPFYNITINDDDETGVYYNALVEQPAHQKMAIAFDDQKKPIKYHFNEEERTVLGVMISADTPIYRQAIPKHQIPEHYVVFNADTIKRIFRKFHGNMLQTKVNEMHDPNRKLNGVIMEQSYIIGGDKNPSAPAVFSDMNLQDGTWIASYHIQNDKVWEKYKSGEYGFSVEGIFDIDPITIKKQFNKQTNKSKQMKNKTVWGKLREQMFGKAPDKFAEVTAADGTVLIYEGELAVGTAVFVQSEDGEQIPAPAETYGVEMDGQQWVVVIDANGLIESLEEVQEEEIEAAQEEQVDEEFSAILIDFKKEFDTLRETFTSTIEELNERMAKIETAKESKFSHQPMKTNNTPEGKSWKSFITKN